MVVALDVVEVGHDPLVHPGLAVASAQLVDQLVRRGHLVLPQGYFTAAPLTTRRIGTPED